VTARRSEIHLSIKKDMKKEDPLNLEVAKGVLGYRIKLYKLPRHLRLGG